MAFFTISRVKNLLTAGPDAKKRFREKKAKGNLVDPASRHNACLKDYFIHSWPNLRDLAAAEVLSLLRLA